MMQIESRSKAMYTISWHTALGCLKLENMNVWGHVSKIQMYK